MLVDPKNISFTENTHFQNEDTSFLLTLKFICKHQSLYK